MTVETRQAAGASEAREAALGAPRGASVAHPTATALQPSPSCLRLVGGSLSPLSYRSTAARIV